jgi:hypothetical protein
MTVDLAAAWPSARAQMGAVLRARGLQAADADDVAQEVAVRLWRNPPCVDSEEHLIAWCCRVAINLHIDTTRRQRFLGPEPPADVAGYSDTAVTAERRMVLEVLVDGIAQLSDEERRLLFEPERAESRRDAVRLAVRRHRLRARLASLVEGMTAAIVGTRQFVRHLSKPAKASLAAAPIVAAGLVLAPMTGGGRPSVPPATAPGAARPSVTVKSEPATATGEPQRDVSRSHPSTLEGTKPAALPERSASARPVVVADPAGVPVRVIRDKQADGQPLVCTGGLVGGCVRLPAPFENTLPTLP